MCSSNKSSDSYVQELSRLVQSKEFTKAESLINVHQLQEPNDSYLWWKYGYLLLDQRNVQTAIGAFHEALHIDCDCFPALRGLAYSYMELEDWPNAEDAILHCLSQEENANFYVFLGVVLGRQGRDSDAIRAYHNAIAIRPDWDEAYYNLGISHRFLYQIDEAAESFETAIQLDPKVAYYHRELGLTYIALNKFSKALSELGLSIALDSQDALAYFYLAITLQNIGRNHEAEDAMRKARTLDPECDMISSFSSFQYLENM